ncbi:unnamed protein product [Linum tenue]|uniref:Uncharacterized protein n=1 Tax=Linum tenue TaxID=586396 RepID=A0AAV0LTR5_9ROSI|nr:unnamed protein product [Linum tenue]
MWEGKKEKKRIDREARKPGSKTEQHQSVWRKRAKRRDNKTSILLFSSSSHHPHASLSLMLQKNSITQVPSLIKIYIQYYHRHSFALFCNSHGLIASSLHIILTLPLSIDDNSILTLQKLVHPPPLHHKNQSHQASSKNKRIVDASSPICI